MKETAFAKQAVETVLAEAEMRGSRMVDRVDVLVGELEGTSRVALDEAFAVAARGTLLEGVPLRTIVQRARGRCPRCAKSRPLPVHVRKAIGGFEAATCRACSGPLSITHGWGFRVTGAVMYFDKPRFERTRATQKPAGSSWI